MIELTREEKLLYKEFMRVILFHKIKDKHVLRVLSFMISNFKRWEE